MTKNILLLIFTLLIVAYPFLEKLIGQENRDKVLIYIYAPIGLLYLIITSWVILSSHFETNQLANKMLSQEKITGSLTAVIGKVSSFEIRTRYVFEYEYEVNRITMDKANPIKAYLVKSQDKSKKIVFSTDNPKIYYPTKNMLEFRFSFTPENPEEIFGKKFSLLENFDLLYLPYQSFTHFLALVSIGKENKLKSIPLVYFQVIINGKVYIDEKQEIKDIEPGSLVLIFQSQPKLFENIENYFLDTN